LYMPFYWLYCLIDCYLIDYSRLKSYLMSIQANVTEHKTKHQNENENHQITRLAGRARF
jgi:hypothetical protein